MLGQTFAPLFDPNQKPVGGPEGQSGAPQAIQTLNTRLPRVLGAGAPAPAALLNSPGSAGLPTQNDTMSPVIKAILQAVLGHFSPQQQAAPSAPSPAQPLPTNVKPKIEYEPLPGGTAGPNPSERDRPDQRTPDKYMGGFNYHSM